MLHNNHLAPEPLTIHTSSPVRLLWRYVHTQWRRAFGLNVSQINELLFIGGEFRPLQWPQLQSLGIRAVLSLQAERADAFAGTPPIQQLRLPVADFHPPSIEQLKQAMAFIHAAHARHLPVLVHCHAGVGRAALTASAFLVTQGRGAADAFKHIYALRPILALNSRQQARLLEWEQRRSVTA